MVRPFSVLESVPAVGILVALMYCETVLRIAISTARPDATPEFSQNLEPLTLRKSSGVNANDFFGWLVNVTGMKLVEPSACR